MVRIFLFLALLFMASCYEPKEGCLDINAVNFDASADEDCCCEYPVLNLQISPKYNGAGWSPGVAYQNDLGNWFRLQRFVFYLSEATMRDASSGTLYQVNDTVRVQRYVASDTVNDVLIDDFLLYRFPTFLYAFGEFVHPGSFDEVSVRFGLSGSARSVVPTSVLSNHALREQSDSLWWGPTEGYIFAKMIVFPDSAAALVPDTLHFRASDLGNLFLTGQGNFTQKTAENFTIKIQLQYDLLFQGVNFSVRDTSAWKNKIVGNLQEAFTITP